MANTATSLYFDGSDYLKVTDTEKFNFGYDDYTFECWFQVTANITATQRILTTEAGAFGAEDICLRLGGGSPNEIQFYHNGGTAYYAIATAFSGTDPLNRWCHLAGVKSGKSFAVFIDGKLTGHYYASSISSGGTSGQLFIGGYYSSSDNEYFTGYLDEIRISKTARYGNVDIPTTIMKSHQVAGRGTNDIKPSDTSLLITSNGTSTTSDTIVDDTGQSTLTVTGAVRAQNSNLFG